MQLTLHPMQTDLHNELIRYVARPNIMNCTGNTASDQHNLGMKVAGLLVNGEVPVIAGGGHETA